LDLHLDDALLDLFEDSLAILECQAEFLRACQVRRTLQFGDLANLKGPTV